MLRCFSSFRFCEKRRFLQPNQGKNLALRSFGEDAGGEFLLPITVAENTEAAGAIMGGKERNEEEAYPTPPAYQSTSENSLLCRISTPEAVVRGREEPKEKTYPSLSRALSGGA